MADSDIQFLGNWNSQQPSSNSSFVSAIVLTPVRPAHTNTTPPFEAPRTFSRTQTSVIHVGRIPATDPALTGGADHWANFVNPVMSRNHAKITFSDSGAAFVIDTNSHHGTWVARPHGLDSGFKLAPESPFQLQDGDKLTFGKEVQKNGICHEPLTVAVKLLRTATSPSAMSISSAGTSPSNKLSSPKRNRFGLDHSSDSDGDFSSDSEDAKDATADPCTGANAIHVELPFKRATEKRLAFDSPEPSKEFPGLFSSSNTHHSPSTSQHISYSPPTPVYSPLLAPFSPESARHSPAPKLPFPSLGPDVEFDGMGDQFAMQASNPIAYGTSISNDANADANAIPKSLITTPNPNTNPNTNLTTSVTLTAQAPGLPPWRPNTNLTWSGLNLPTIIERMPDLLPHPPRRIGRLLNPLWMRGVRGRSADGERTGSSNNIEGSGHALERERQVLDQDIRIVERGRHGHGHGHGSRGRLDEDWGLYGKSFKEVKDEVKRLGERVDEVRREIGAVKANGVNGEDASSLHDTLSARLEDFARQLQVLQDANVAQRTDNPSRNEIAEIHENIATLKKDLAIRPDNCALKEDIFTLRAQQGTLGVDITYLKARAHAAANDLQGLLGVPETGLLGSVETLKSEAFQRDFEVRALQEDGQAIRNDLGKFRGEFASVQSDLDKLQENLGRVDAAAKKVVGGLEELKAAQATTDQDFGARIREEVRAELQTFKEQAEELQSSLPGKRKRGHDEAFSLPEDILTPVPAPPAPRPYKRLRIAADCAVAGAVGALSAWLGLAFL